MDYVVMSTIVDDIPPATYTTDITSELLTKKKQMLDTFEIKVDVK